MLKNKLFRYIWKYASSLRQTLNPQRHWFHMLEPSPWPFCAGWGVFGLAMALVGYMHRLLSIEVLVGALVFLIAIACLWLKDVIDEADSGHHTSIVQSMIRFGFLLFIVSEIMLFFSFFWALLHSSFSPSIWIGSEWPPASIETVSWTGIPLANTFLLLASSLSVSSAHAHLVKIRNPQHVKWKARAVETRPHYSKVWSREEILLNNTNWYRDMFHYGQEPHEFNLDVKKFPDKSAEISSALRAAIYLGFLFLFLQVHEYSGASFSISDSVFGSAFYMLTGLHGFHVLVGILFLSFCLYRIQVRGALTSNHHVAFECAAWYWHFVDVVWLLLVFIVYFVLG